jgi:hypothetical protein
MFPSQENMWMDNGLLLCYQFPPIPHLVWAPPLSIAPIPADQHADPRGVDLRPS